MIVEKYDNMTTFNYSNITIKLDNNNKLVLYKSISGGGPGYETTTEFDSCNRIIIHSLYDIYSRNREWPNKSYDVPIECMKQMSLPDNITFKINNECPYNGYSRVKHNDETINVSTMYELVEKLYSIKYPENTLCIDISDENSFTFYFCWKD